MEEAVSRLLREVKVRTPQGASGAKGGLMSTIQKDIIEKGTPAVKGVVATDSIYGLAVEKGRRPGKWPPGGKGSKERPILAWVKHRFGVSGSTADRMEYLVRRKIGEQGTEGVFMFEQAIEENFKDIQKIFERYGLRLVRELEK
ncbi:MAG: hypothetical protein JXK94_02150 [Deltaproteobacteria bacterium]|nr:hypothetical protein [Deltaproteobacteria bacterium]